MVPRARRSPGLASYPPSPPRSALTGASSGSRSWSSSARDGAAGSLFRKRVAVSAGGRSLYEIGRDSGGAAFFGTPPPVPLLGQREGDPAGVGLCVRRRGFFVPLFQGGFSMTNRPFCEIPAMQCPVCGQAARVLVCEEARPPVLADVVFCYHCAPRRQRTGRGRAATASSRAGCSCRSGSGSEPVSVQDAEALAGAMVGAGAFGAFLAGLTGEAARWVWAMVAAWWNA